MDSLTSLLREERVRRVLEPMLAGQEMVDVSADDVQFLIALGLCRRHPEGGIAIANPIH